MEEGWWSGSINGKSGVFPSNFVKELDAAGDELESNSTAADEAGKGGRGPLTGAMMCVYSEGTQAGIGFCLTQKQLRVALLKSTLHVETPQEFFFFNHIQACRCILLLFQFL